MIPQIYVTVKCCGHGRCPSWCRRWRLPVVKQGARYLVVDEETYETFPTYNEALACAKSDVGLDGWHPTECLMVCLVVAEVSSPSKKRTTVKEFAR